MEIQIFNFLVELPLSNRMTNNSTEISNIWTMFVPSFCSNGFIKITDTYFLTAAILEFFVFFCGTFSSDFGIKSTHLSRHSSFNCWKRTLVSVPWKINSIYNQFSTIFHSTHLKVTFLSTKGRISAWFCKCYTLQHNQKNILQKYEQTEYGDYKNNKSCPLICKSRIRLMKFFGHPSTFALKSYARSQDLNM